MEHRKHNPEAETGVAVDFVAKIKEKAAQLQAERHQAEENTARLGNQKTELQNLTPLASESPERIRKNSRAGIAATLALGLMASSAATATGYMYLYKKGPFAPVELPAITTPAYSSDPNNENDNSTPTEVLTNEDLQRSLSTQKISATDKDFAFSTPRPQLHAKALMFKLIKNGENIEYEWKPVRERITRVHENQALIAIKIVNPYVKDNPQKHFAPEGLPYRASTVDPKDPTIMYFYYDCNDKKNSDLLGQIGLKNPQNPKKLLWGVSFSIPDCE